MVNNRPMQKRLTYIFLIVLNTFSVFAQDLEFQASAPKYVRVGEQFQIQFSTNKNVDDFTPPGFEGFDFLGGPMQSTSSSSSYENGKWIHSSTVSFIYYLQAKQAGKFTIGPAKAIYKKNNVSSNSVNIEVVGNSQQQSTGASSSTNAQNQTSFTTTESNGNDIFLSLELDNKNVYVGEQITAYVKLYTKVSLASINWQTYKGPDFSGFFRQDIDLPDQVTLTQEKVGNDIYSMGILQKMIIYPQKSGNITIEPISLTVNTKKKVVRRDIFGFPDVSYAVNPIQLTSKSASVYVKALPAPQPDGYTGAVGQFNIAGSLNSNRVRTNDAISFRISLSGKGNIKLIEKINSEIPASIEVYDPIMKLLQYLAMLEHSK
jgi:hypothetical protein